MNKQTTFGCGEIFKTARSVDGVAISSGAIGAEAVPHREVLHSVDLIGGDCRKVHFPLMSCNTTRSRKDFPR